MQIKTRVRYARPGSATVRWARDSAIISWLSAARTIFVTCRATPPFPPSHSADANPFRIWQSEAEGDIWKPH